MENDGDRLFSAGISARMKPSTRTSIHWYPPVQRTCAASSAVRVEVGTVEAVEDADIIVTVTPVRPPVCCMPPHAGPCETNRLTVSTLIIA